jgi:hypothetical protein
MKWVLFLQEFTFLLRHQSGSLKKVANVFHWRVTLLSTYTPICWNLILSMSCIQMIPHLVRFILCYESKVTVITLCF